MKRQSFTRPLLALVSVLLAACSEKPAELMDISRLASDEVAVSAAIPASRKLALTSPLGVTFSQDLAPVSHEPGTYLDAPPATLQPAVRGFWKWASAARLEFIPDENYQPNTQYKLTLAPDIAVAAGLTFRGPRTLTFTAEPFRVESAQLFRERPPGPERRYVVKGSFEFNYPVDPPAFGQSLSVALARRGPVAVTIETQNPSQLLSFQTEPIAADDHDEKITATLKAGLLPVTGGTALTADERRETAIPAIERLAIGRVQLESRKEQRLVRIDVSDEVAPDDLRRALTITPEVADLAISSEGRRLLLTGRWEFGQTYKLKIQASLTSTSGLVLEREFSRSLRVDDIEPYLEIAGAGNYLSLRGERKLAIETVNVDKLTVELDRVYPNNLVHFLQAQSLSGGGGYPYGRPRRYGGHGGYGRAELAGYGANLYRRDLAVSETERNRLVVTPVNLNDVLASDSRGIFRLSVRKEDERGLADAKWVVATDLGLVVKTSESELLAAVASIQRLEPLAGVDVRILSYNNQVLARGKTDAQGLVSLRLPRAADRGQQPFVVAATAGGDMSFLVFDDTRIPTGDLDVGGVTQPTSGFEAFLYADRGVHRPGDTVHLAWMVRDIERRAPPEFPLMLRVLSPQGREFTSVRVTSGREGSGESALDIPAWAPTGNYVAQLMLDEETAIGRHVLRIEEFIPDRMKVDVDVRVDGREPDLVRPGQDVAITATAMTLFGPPAAERDAVAAITYLPVPITLKDWPQFHCGDPDPERSFPREMLSSVKTDMDGRASWTIAAPQARDYQGWIRARIEVDVTELGGGRIKRAAQSWLIAPNERVVGLRRTGEQESDYAQPGRPLAFEAIVADLEGRLLAQPAARLKILRKQWRTVLRRDSAGRYRYISEYDEQLQEERTVDLVADVNPLAFSVESQGSYRLVLESETASGPVRGSLDFYVYGWGYSPWAMSKPEQVQIKLDKESYRTGETLNASLEAPFAGLMLLTIERDRVLYRQWLRLDSNTATVGIRLPAGTAPNAYLVATLLRPLDSVEQHAPARAFGAAPIFMDRAPNSLDVELAAPEVTRPRTELAVAFRVGHLQAGRQAQVTIAAVDEGILQITNFTTPSPLDFFCQRRRLSLESFDIWSLLLPEYTRILRQSSPGGGDAEMLMETPPGGGLLSPVAARRVKPVALWSGIVRGAAAWDTVRFDLPEFNGTLRLMAVAAAEDRFGAASQTTQVTDPIVLSPNLPRFLAPGDEIAVPVQIYNGIDETGGGDLSIRLELMLEGPVTVQGEASRQLVLAGGREQVVPFRVRATDEIGPATLTFSADGGGERVSVTTELAVRPPQPREVIATTGVVRPDRPAAVTLSDDWYAGTGHARVTVSPLPIAQFGSALTYLLKYPYGCIEQKTSRGFPLLYFAELARRIAPEAFGDRDADYFVNSTIDYLVAMSVPGRGFATWPGATNTSFNAWASVYATHFLVEAERKDYLVPKPVLVSALADVASLARSSEQGWDNSWPARQRLNTRAYAVYVLALAGRPERGAMDYLLQNQLPNLTPAARTHLAGAFGLSGQTDVMRQILPAQDAPRPETRSLGYSFDSPARAEAILLDVLATVDPEHEQIPIILARLAQHAKNGRWHNTQENGFALLALGKVISHGGGEAAPGEILIDGEVVATFGMAGQDPEQPIVVSGEDWQRRRVEIRATGPGLAYYTILDEGVPRQAPAQVSEGLLMTRTYFDDAGERIDPRDINQGAAVFCRLALASSKGTVKNVVVSDLVPAGLEIENPRLMGSAHLDWIERVDPRAARLDLDYLDVRDDRLLLFTTAESGQRIYYYGLRAVTAGRFVLPPVRAEAMYDPDVRSVQDGGEVSIAIP
jgi:uncharacterized protein YfaS (alpha-2-macroglobulin family)